MSLWKFNAANFPFVCFTHGRPHRFIRSFSFQRATSCNPILTSGMRTVRIQTSAVQSIVMDMDDRRQLLRVILRQRYEQ